MTRKRITELLVIAGLGGLATSFVGVRDGLLHFAFIFCVVIIGSLAVLACRAVLIVVHESGHALMTRLVGWRVRAVVIGAGSVVCRFQVAGIPVVIHLWPIWGYVQPEFASTHGMRWKFILVVLAGPAFELALLALLLWLLDVQAILVLDNAARTFAAVTLCVMILFDVISSLAPWTFRTPERAFKTDGYLIVGALFAPQTVGLPSKSLAEIADDSGYAVEAVEFVRKGLAVACQRLDEYGAPAHVRGQTLCTVMHDLAIKNYAASAREVVASWGVTTNHDFGRIVFALAESGWLQKTDSDSLDDFNDADVFAGNLATGPSTSVPSGAEST